MAPFVHETAVVDRGATVGEGAQVWHFVHVSKGAHIGPGVVLGQNVFVGEGVSIGAGTRVQNNVSLFAGVSVDQEVFLGPSCVFTNVRTPRAAYPRKPNFQRTHVERGVTVGANATVLGGHRLGAYAFVAAGAVVTADVAPHVLVVGTPARPQGFVCRCGERLRDSLGPEADGAGPGHWGCQECGLHYGLNSNGECQLC